MHHIFVCHQRRGGGDKLNLWTSATRLILTTLYYKSCLLVITACSPYSFIWKHFCIIFFFIQSGKFQKFYCKICSIAFGWKILCNFACQPIIELTILCLRRFVHTVWVKKSPPAVFWHFVPNGWEFLNQFLHTYYTFLSTLDYKFLFNYLHL